VDPFQQAFGRSATHKKAFTKLLKECSTNARRASKDTAGVQVLHQACMLVFEYHNLAPISVDEQPASNVIWELPSVPRVISDRVTSFFFL
jgi:hypothetical protein